MTDVLTLIAETFSTDSIGQRVASETTTDVFCEVSSVTQSEWFEAGRNGLKAEYRATMPLVDYSGQAMAEYRGTRYSIYRTYRNGEDLIELYLERKGGV